MSNPTIETIRIFTEHPEDLKPGVEVHTTTSDFDFDNITGCFTRNTSYAGEVVAELISEDYSEYDPDKCSTGGCYGFSTWKVLEVLEDDSNTMEELTYSCKGCDGYDYHVRNTMEGDL